ncbi:hypothetical protein M2444_004334 [Paenibacillus sp. PastF-3]|uniref:TnsD family Tn7-like transposition protein n=1 Tax=unclassified Paenibacillus TaxID=185978 RepID=UPI00247610DB|nr:TnsD family Tn7-like transposition protein [Paenibacillus sp. PastF-3]MDH6372521.1 hypothetical protein [Paenibacillus sp. PastF-3]
MIFFPTIYPDELLYSAFARYHRNSGNESIRQTMKELFDNTSTCSSVWFPSQLDRLTRQIPGQIYSSDELIQKHTLIPYFTPFIPPKRAERLEETMKFSTCSPANMILGRAAFSVKPKQKLMYCTGCVREDRSKYGEAYWHRGHQLEGVYLCPMHGEPLWKSYISHQMQKNRFQYITLEKALVDIGELISTEILPGEFSQNIAIQSLLLLEKEFPSMGLQSINQYYISRLRSEGYVCKTSNRIRWDKLIPGFSSYYGNKLLANINGGISESDSWLHKLLRKPRVSCHPLRHILLLGFMGDTIERMMDSLSRGTMTTFEPFGHGPWPCLNKAANHYKQPMIGSVKITRGSKTGKPVGTFTCSCGFVYSRTGPDDRESDRYQIGRVKEFGVVWKNRLVELSGKQLSLRKKAEILGCDPQTVLNHQK